MAVALPVPTVDTRVTEQARAAGWTALSGLIAAFASLPLVMLLARPVAGLVFVRGSAYADDWGRAILLTMLLLAPSAYTLFVAVTGELLKGRVSPATHLNTIRVAAAGIVPYIVFASIAVLWTTGPQESFVVAAGLTVPFAVCATIWASARP